MYSFRNDYSELVHPDILDLIIQSNLRQNLGYGLDKHSEVARKLIIEKIGKENLDIHFLAGGTSCNKIVIAHSLKPYEAVVSVASGHINVHEAGAIESSGHKVLTTKGKEGKITPEEIHFICHNHKDEHMVVPKMVYISNSTEIGTIYTKAELQAIYHLCQQLGLYLFIDGARLGVALSTLENDLTLTDLASLCDCFYIGGTKNGAMLGEALVIVNDALKADFRNTIKQNGGLLAKGYLIGIQFEALFKNNLFFKLAKHANEMAAILKEELKRIGVQLAYDSPTNQQFIILKRGIVEKLEENYDFEIWEEEDDLTTIRLVTSWATKEEVIELFIDELNKLLKEQSI
ncbi:MAG: beta-eliminating lyase-related protein [Bacilli bacterium]|nr:beta-eliminating lyase-related protein [Bacilli bacterium]